MQCGIINDDDVFIASSSQRAIISLLGSFEPNPETYPWFLSTGFHRPLASWDKRLTQMKGNHSRITLNRDTWKLEEFNPPYHFDGKKPVREDYSKHFTEKLFDLLGD